MDHLCDIGRMVANPLQIAGDEQQLGRTRNGGRIFDHVADKIAEYAVVEGIDLGIRRNHFPREIGVACGIGSQHVVDHLAGEIAHCRKQGQRFEPVASLDHANPLGDVLGIIADPLDHACDLERGDDLAQIVCHRRAQSDDADRELVDLGFQSVDLLVARDHAIPEFNVAANHRVERLGDRHFGKPAHLRDQAAKPGDVLIEGLDRMFAHQP